MVAAVGNGTQPAEDALGRAPTTRPRCRTCSASPRSSRTATSPTTRTATSSTSTSRRRAGRSSRRSRATSSTRRSTGCTADAVLELRPVRVQGRDRHLVRGAAGRRGGGAAPRRRPELTPDQVEWLLERSATRRDPSTGCASCPVGRDSLTGWGDLDVAAALTLLGNGTHLPTARRARAERRRRRARRIRSGLPRTIIATLDFWDDPVDVYSIHLNAGRRALRPARPRRPARRRRSSSGSPAPCTSTGPPREMLATRAARSIDRRRPAAARLRRARRRHVLPRGRRSAADERRPTATRSRSRSSRPARQASSSSSGTSRSGRAGLPTTSVRGGTSFVTTAPAPTNASSPISTAGQSTAPAPTRAPRRIVGPSISSCRRSVRPMKLSFDVTTQGAMKTCSSSVEYAVM